MLVAVGERPCDDEQDEMLCHACLKGHKVDQAYHGISLHTKCFECAVRSRHRKMQQGEDSNKTIAADHTCMLREPDTWHARVHPAILCDSMQKAESREAALSFANSFGASCTFTKNFEREEELVMDKPTYKVWARKWKNMDEVSASEDFDQWHRTQKGREDRGKQRMISQDEPIKRRIKDTGSSSKDGVFHRTPINTEEAHAIRKRIRGKTVASLVSSTQRAPTAGTAKRRSRSPSNRRRKWRFLGATSPASLSVLNQCGLGESSWASGASTCMMTSSALAEICEERNKNSEDSSGEQR